MLKDETPPNPILEQLEAEQRWASSQRRHRFLTAAVIVLVAVIAGSAWYAHPLLRNSYRKALNSAGYAAGVSAMGTSL